jgi:hypothetical protein
MKKYFLKERPRRSVRHAWQKVSVHLTPQEKKVILFIAGLFVLGAVVRWARLSLAL